MRLRTFTFAFVVTLSALYGLAFGAVRVYENEFENADAANELQLTGKGCEAELRGNKGQLGVFTAEGGTRCRLRLPVLGSESQPDHIVEATAKLLPRTPEQIRDKVYVAITVREGGGGYYELRIYPEKKKYSVTRKPEDAAFPITDKDNKIGGTGDKNQLTLRAIGDSVSAKINKIVVDEVIDPQPGALPGTKISIVLGQEGSSSDGAAAWFKDLRVLVPDP